MADDPNKHPDPNKRPAIFNREGAARIVAAVQYLERQPRNEVKQARGRAPDSGVRVAKTQTGGLSAMDGDVPGYGEIELYGFSGIPGDPVEPTGIVTVCFNLGGAIDPDILINVSGGSGGWWAVVEPCPTS